MLWPVIQAWPAIDGTIAAYSPTFAAASTRPKNKLPMIDSWMKSSPTYNTPRAADWAMRADVPVPQGERSIAFSP